MGLLCGLLLIVLNSFDALVTYHFTKLYGFDVEANPLIRSVMNFTGDWWVLPKLLFGILVGACMWLMWKSPLVRRVSYLILIIYSLLTVYHICLLTIFGR